MSEWTDAMAFFVHLGGDGMLREGRQERGQGIAGGAIEREWQRMGSSRGNGREWTARGWTKVREWQRMGSSRGNGRIGAAEDGRK